MIEIYEDAAGGWRWRMKAGNGEIVADGSESYASRGNAQKAVDRFREAAGTHLSQVEPQ